MKVGDTFICKQCGAATVNKYRAKTRIFCSRKCACAYSSEKAKNSFNCKICGSEFVVPTGQLIAGRHTALYCSNSCSGKAKVGENNPNYKNGKHITAEGYVVISVDGIKKLEHRHVMEQHLERSLFSHENVHHINGDKQDNRLCNLELWSTMQPSGQRVTDKIAFAKEILRLYEN